ncbi:beta-aspartyl-peptidase [bacterium]|nr:beta-aspartyl-peptidase [bacterium]
MHFAMKSSTSHRWAIAIHGGAGTIARDASPERRRAYLEALEKALAIGRDILASGGTSLDAVEQVVRAMEDDPLFNAGHGAAVNRNGEYELDSCIMDGRTLATGAIAAVRHVRNPISLARRIMEDGEHVLIAGPGGDEYARQAGLETVENSYFFTEDRHQRWQRLQQHQLGRHRAGVEAGVVERGTVGAVAVDCDGNIAAATSTGGLTNKLPGRVGDSPLAGVGTYANNATCAVSCTGNGEDFIRNTVAFRVSAGMEYKGLSLDVATEAVITRLPAESGGLIAVDRHGNLSLPYNSVGMNRGAADSTGRFQVAIWDW